ncbi:class F sortase [Lentibacillus jeotgali]|uniref:class F sortase n=1 Tax=Lentibacillus jeotgali TaxID=558169 RepID=UPI0002627C06|nr:class F sortase [Lentibacillus jeotgali]
MWKFLSILLLMLMVSCGQTQSTGSSGQPDKERVNDQGEATEEVDDSAKQTDHNSNQGDDHIQTTSSPIITDPEYGIKPETIQIDSIGVDSVVEGVGLMENGEMAVPEDFRITGWYEQGAKPGERGSAVIAGHVDDKTGPGVFFDLEDLQKGDEVEVLNDKGDKLVFEVVDKQVFPMDDAPVKDIFGYTSRRMLNLVTCTGPFDESRGGHIDRLVVYTELKE